MIKKLICVLILVYLSGCSNTSQQTFNAETARDAIVDYIEQNPNAFVSPGRSETAEDVRKTVLKHWTSSKVFIGRFMIDLDNKTYTLGHLYSLPDGDYSESWEWQGKFVLDSDNQWILSKPNFIQVWSD